MKETVSHQLRAAAGRIHALLAMRLLGMALLALVGWFFVRSLLESPPMSAAGKGGNSATRRHRGRALAAVGSPSLYDRSCVPGARDGGRSVRLVRTPSRATLTGSLRINDLGGVVGHRDPTCALCVNRPFLHDGTGMRLIGAAQGDAFAVNAAGQVTGDCSFNGADPHTFVWASSQTNPTDPGAVAGDLGKSVF